MSDKVHWVIPGAALALEARPQPSASHETPALPNLRRLLGAMTPGKRLELPEDSPALPHEMLLAHLNNLPGEPGRVPWTAFEHGLAGKPCATLRLCHWQVGTDNVMLSPPAALALSAGEGRVLLAAMSPYFDEDGITLTEVTAQPGTWLATGEPFRDLATISLDRAVGKRLTRSFFEAQGASAALIRKLQNEMQMLLYTHAIHDEREQRGLLPVNSFWVTGAGVLNAIMSPSTGIRIEHRLHEPAQLQDLAAHARAWQCVDADLCERLLRDVKAGKDVTLSLCGERAAQTFERAAGGPWQRIKRAFAKTSEHQILDTL